jgi:tetratricopeptide (TPR) repeat protein
VVVVTSRNALPGLIATEGAHPVRLGLLAEDEARHMLSWRIGAERVAAEPAAVVEIIRLCARLPLALAIVAARAATHPEFPLSSLAAELRASHGSLEAFAGTDPVTDMRAVFSWSLSALSPAAALMFRLLGVLAAPDISLPAAASLAAVDLRQARALLNELARAHLVTEHLPGRYACHDLLRAHAAELIREAADSAGADAADTDTAVRRLLEHYLYTAHAADRLLNPHRDPIITAAPSSGVTPEDLATHELALAWFTAEHAVLLAAVRHAVQVGYDTHAWQLAWTMTAFFQRDGRWNDWVTAQSCALSAARRRSDQPGQAHAHRHLGRAYARLGQHDDAQRNFQQAHDLYGEVGDLAGQANTHLGLAWLHGLRNDNDQALWHSEQSLELYLATTDLGGQARGLNSVGFHHAMRGDHERALGFCQRALSLHQQTGDREGQAETWDSLGYAHHELGRYQQAAACYEKAVGLYRTLGDRFGEAIVLQHAADTYLRTGDADAARVAWQLTLDIFDQLNHPDADRVRMKLRELEPSPAGREK